MDFVVGLKLFLFSSRLCSMLMSQLPSIVLSEFSSNAWELSMSISTWLLAWSLVWLLVVFSVNLLRPSLGFWYHCQSCLHNLVFLALLDLTIVVCCFRGSKVIWSAGSRIWAFLYWRSYIQHPYAFCQQADSHHHCLHLQMRGYFCKRGESGRLPCKAQAFHLYRRKGTELSWVHSFGSVRWLLNAR